MAGKAEKAGRKRGAERRRPAEGPLALDRLVHERLRLGILGALASGGTTSFTELRDLLGTTDGNLSIHARRLEEAGYVACEKSFAGRVPKTSFRVTASGRRALERYVEQMQAILAASRGKS